MDDLSAMFVAENEAPLRQRFLFPHLPSNRPRQLANKATLYSLCAQFDVPCPRSITAHSTSDVSEFIELTGLPIVMKAAEQWRLLSDKNYNTKVIHDRATLFALYEQIRREEDSPIAIQEYISGDDWVYHGYSNFEADLFVSFTGRKLLDYPRGAGSTVLGLSLRNKELCRQAEAFLKAVAYSGICDMDWRLDNRDGQYKMLDCNPRIGLNFRMFEDTAGIDVIRAQYLNLRGCRVESAPMIERRLLMVESLYFFSLVHGERRRASKMLTSTKQLIAIKELAWWRNDDPLPFFAMGLRLAFGIIRSVMFRIANYPFRRLGRKSAQDQMLA